MGQSIQGILAKTEGWTQGDGRLSACDNKMDNWVADAVHLKEQKLVCLS